MPFTQTDLDALNKKIALGVKKTRYGDKETEYMDMEQLLQLRDLMQAEISGTPTLAQRRKIAIFRSTTNRC